MKNWALRRRGATAPSLPGLSRGRLLLAALVLLLIVAVGCSEGSYPVDIFFEMHYQPSYNANEPPRLSPPEGSVPWFPVPAASKTGAELFAINCSMCHGVSGKGDGAVLEVMESTYGYVPALPPDLTDPLVQDQSDEGLAGIIRGGLVVMPPFEKLLSQEEVQLILDHIRTFPAQ